MSAGSVRHDEFETGPAAEAASFRGDPLFEGIAEAIPQLVWSTRADGYSDYFNSRWLAFTGTALADNIGDSWLDVVNVEDRPRAYAAWHGAVQHGGPYEVEYRIRRADGAFRWFLARGLPVRSEDGSILRWFGTCTDINDAIESRESLADDQAELERLVYERTTDLKRAHERLLAEAGQRQQAEEALRQAQKMEAIGQLTGGVAHDFNNVLTVIMGGLDIIERRLLDRPNEDDVARMRRAALAAMQGARRAATLTQRLLAFSRRQALQSRAVDVNALVSNMIELFQRTLGDAVTVTINLDDDLPPAHADPHQLESALLNLAVNARDAMAGGGTLTLVTARRVITEAEADMPDAPDPGDYVLIAVTDTGTGMDRATRERAFDPFFTTKEVGQGSGLGLSQVYGFVRQSHGHVALRSAPGEGTTVFVLLPVDAGPAQGVETATPSPEPVRPATSRTVLVVEDREDVRQYTVEALRELGHRVVEAAEAGEAMEALRRDDAIALLFSDIMLPGMSGRELARTARAIRPGLPVVLTTGHTPNTLINRAPPGAPERLLLKPFVAADLAAVIADAFAAADDPNAN